MTPEDISEEGPKPFWKWWVIALAGVLAVIGIAVAVRSHSTDPVRVGFIGSTNYQGETMLVFRGTNDLSRKITYFARIGTNMTTMPRVVVFAHDNSSTSFGEIRGGEGFTFYLRAPQNDAVWKFTWIDVEKRGGQVTRWDVIRDDCNQFLRGHGMPGLARVWKSRDSVHTITGTYVKE